MNYQSKNWYKYQNHFTEFNLHFYYIIFKYYIHSFVYNSIMNIRHVLLIEFK